MFPTCSRINENEGYIWIVTLIFGNSRLFTHRSSKYMYLRAKYTKYKMAKTKFSIWRYVICEICKKKWVKSPISGLQSGWYNLPPPHRRSPPPTRQSMQRPNEQQQRLSSLAINYNEPCNCENFISTVKQCLPLWQREESQYWEKMPLVAERRDQKCQLRNSC